MQRWPYKGKAFLIGALVATIPLWAWALLAMDYWTTFNVVVFTGPAILVGGFAGMILERWID